MVMLKNTKKGWYHIYIYEHLLLHKYLGYIDLLSFIDFRDLDSNVLLKTGFELDFNIGDTLIVSCLDHMFVVGFNKVKDRWELLKRINRVAGT
jgi:hypothetical protein